jgi:PQ loop repeat
VLRATQIAGFVGVGLAGAAYVPQIWHLVRVHCSAGLSRFAFCVWLGASLLVTIHAIATRAVVFILLGGVQIVATTVILIYVTKYASSYCVGHAPGDFEAETKRRGIGREGPGRRLRTHSMSRPPGSILLLGDSVLSLDDYVAREGGRAVASALGRTPDEVIEDNRSPC